MEVNFHLPGLRQNYPLNMLVLSMLKKKPEWFREGVRIASFFGEFPTSLWNGGRPSNYDQCDAAFIRNVVKSINAEGVPVRYTYTNMLLTKEDLSDLYCNFCMQVADNGMNEVMIFSPVLEEYIRERYPSYKLNSSTCKEIRDINQVNEELKKDYYLVVLDYNFNNKYEELEKIQDKARCEILVNAVCTPDCPRRSAHYQNVARNQRILLENRELPPEQRKPLEQWSCEYGEYNCIYTIQGYSTYVSPEDIWEKYVPMGFHHFKIEGRTANIFSLVETYTHYLIRPEKQGEVRIMLLNNLVSSKVITVNPFQNSSVVVGADGMAAGFPQDMNRQEEHRTSKEVQGMEREVYWHLPGFCYFRMLNQIIMNMMKDYPDKFRQGYRIGSVYGTFPGAIWNGGRVSFGLTCKRDMESILKIYNSRGIPVRFTWTNSLIEEKHLQDTYCNLIMRLADNGLNQVLVNTPELESYIRREYPRYPLISSTTKRITDLKSLQEELDKDYCLVVLDYDLNHDLQVLEAIEPQARRVEILVNEVCYPGCTMRAEHYRQQSRLQLEYDIHTGFPCPNQSTPRTFAECMDRPAFINNEQIGSYIRRGFCNFKIAGRGMPLDYVKESYLYFLVREEHRDFIRGKVDGLLAQFKAAQQGLSAGRSR